MSAKSKNKMVAIIMGSGSDLKIMKAATEPLKKFGLKYEIKIVSAHRSPKFMYEFAESAESRGIGVIIAGAGGAAHLPGMVAAITPLPVIGVPVNQTKLKGLDALLSVAQMPKGVPVATVAIDNAYNAGLLAAKILATSDAKLLKKIKTFQNAQKKKVTVANRRLKSKHSL